MSMNRFRVRTGFSLDAEVVERIVSGRSPIVSPQRLICGTSYGIDGNLSNKTYADQIVYMVEQVTAGTPRVIDLNAGSEVNPVYESPVAMAKILSWGILNTPLLLDNTTPGTALEVVFGIEAASAFLRCTVAASLTLTVNPGESIFFDHPAGITLSATTPTVTIQRPSGSGVGTIGAFALMVVGIKP